MDSDKAAYVPINKLGRLVLLLGLKSLYGIKPSGRIRVVETQSGLHRS